MTSKLTTTTAIAIATLVALPAAAETTIRLSTYVNEADIRYEGFTAFRRSRRREDRRQRQGRGVSVRHAAWLV